MTAHTNRYPEASEKNTMAPVFRSGTLARKTMRRKFIETLPMPIPIIRRLLSNIEGPARPYRELYRKAIALPCTNIRLRTIQ